MRSIITSISVKNAIDMVSHINLPMDGRVERQQIEMNIDYIYEKWNKGDSNPPA